MVNDLFWYTSKCQIVINFEWWLNIQKQDRRSDEHILKPFCFNAHRESLCLPLRLGDGRFLIKYVYILTTLFKFSWKHIHMKPIFCLKFTNMGKISIRVLHLFNLPSICDLFILFMCALSVSIIKQMLTYLHNKCWRTFTTHF